MRRSENRTVDLTSDLSKQALRDILSEANSSGEALRLLFQQRKKESKAISYGYLAAKISRKSRGYIADLINGKRAVPVKLAQPLAQALGLELAAQEYFAALVSSEHAKPGQEKEYWRAELEKLKKFFAMHKATPGDLRFSNMYFAFEVFCSISLFGDNCTRNDLVKHFGAMSSQGIFQALDQLIKTGAVFEEGEFLRQRNQHLKIVDQDRFRDLINFIREGLKRAQYEVYQWFQRPKEAFFDSTVISVDRSEFEQKLPHLIKEIEKLKTEIESEQANQLVQFNVQVFPLRYDN